MKSIILAGGNGIRLWPLSRELYPKQLLKIDDDYSFLQKTFIRLMNFCKPCEILTITNKKHSRCVKQQLDQIDKSNILLSEPVSKNTAPAIACGLEYFKQTGNADDVVLIAPSDHLITRIDDFVRTIKNGAELAELGYIVTFGIKPSYAETGYGYIKTENPINSGFKVEKFVEKPDYATAQSYLQSGNYYWNGGIFMAKISVLSEEISKFIPEISECLSKFDIKNTPDIPVSLYNRIQSISIDYAVMEKSDRIALVKLHSDWTDVGSWQALYNIKEKDHNGNVLIGNVVANNVTNSLIYSQKKLLAVSDLDGVVLVETEDASMLCRMDCSQNVRKLYEILKTNNYDKI